jgi:aspartate/tyrosine/aromatic aminotransferase
MFENITAAPADPILGLADLFRADDRPEKLTSELVFTKMKPVKPRF